MALRQLRGVHSGSVYALALLPPPPTAHGRVVCPGLAMAALALRWPEQSLKSLGRCVRIRMTSPIWSRVHPRRLNAV